MLPSDWTSIWYKCLICHRCFQYPDKLIHHKQSTRCGKLYRKRYPHLTRKPSPSSSVIGEKIDRHYNERKSKQSSEGSIFSGSEHSFSTSGSPHQHQSPAEEDEDKLQEADTDDIAEIAVEIDDGDGHPINVPVPDPQSVEILTSPSLFPENDTEMDTTTTMTMTTDFNDEKVPESEAPVVAVKSSTEEIKAQVTSAGNSSLNLKKPDNNFICYFCDFKSKTLNNLETHIYVHTLEKPFACKKCGTEYRQKERLTLHFCKFS